LPPTLAEQIRTALEASRWEADRVLDFGERQARVAEAGADGEVAAVARARLAKLEGLRGSIDRHSREIETGYARLIEGLAGVSEQLVELARAADFSPPSWQGLSRTVELKLSEKREVTIRFSQPGDRGAA
jgi:hypothetical protein